MQETIPTKGARINFYLFPLVPGFGTVRPMNTQDTMEGEVGRGHKEGDRKGSGVF